MRMDSDKLRRWWFIGGLVIVALAVNVFFWQRGTQRKAEAERSAAAQKAIQDAAAAARITIQKATAEHETFLNRYLNAGVDRTPGKKMAALVVASDNRLSNDAIRAVSASHLQTNSVKILSSLFTPEFVSDGFFKQVFDGSREPLRKLGLTNFLDEVVLMREDVQYSTSDASLDHVITAAMQLEVLAVPLAITDENQKWTFESKGAGFTREDAHSLAEERLVKQISSATNFYLIQ